MIYHLPSPISNIAYNYSPYSNMIISAVNYRNNFYPKPDLTRILGIPTYCALLQIQIELKTNALSVSSNLRGDTHRHIKLFMTNLNYATLPNVLYVCPLHPRILIIQKNSTHIASYKIKRFQDENLQVFQKVHRVEQYLLQQIVIFINKQYITAMKIRATGQLIGEIRQNVSYLLTI